ncbi:hypothetical protein LJR225_004061 [Phenylobacterium sp. LjRoot225]|uniref:hypothetical protein n=1 Tax=Phenylobacterium sp. LjRoot225 TaxID=3342285 RepID=UPI003ECD2CAE
MRRSQGAAVGGLGSRRAGHRFVVVVYGDESAATQPWPGHVVHVPTSVDPLVEIRVPFDEVERLPDLIRQLIRGALAASAPDSGVRGS